MLAAYERLTSTLRAHRLKVKRRKRILHANGNQKTAGVDIFISNTVDL